MSKKICKVISFVLSLILLSSVFSICAFAATPSISVSGGTVTNGNEITVNVTLSSSSNAAGGNFTLQYDSAKLSPVSYTSGSLVSGYTNNCNLSYSTNSIRFTFSGSNAITSSGTLVSIRFKAKATGSAALSFTAYKLYNTSGSSISASASGNTITINPVSYILSYNANGGNGAPSSQTIPATISSTVPTYFPKTFLGWSTSSSVTSASYKPGDTYNSASNTTLYAVWKSPATLSTGSTASVTVGFANQVWYYKFIPSISGSYTFESTGSSDTYATLYNSSGSSIKTNDDDGADSNFKLSYSLTSGTTYYLAFRCYSTKTGTFSVTATASVTKYTVTYNGNGGTVSPTSVEVTAGNSVTLPTPSARGGYSCLGWSTSSSATTAAYNCGAKYTPQSSVTLYAVWKSNPTYTVTYNPNGGNVSPTSVNVISGNSTTLPTPAKNFKITYNANGGSGAPPALNLSVPCKGWSKNSSATSATYSCGESFKPTSNTTLYAVWDSSVSTTLSTVEPVKNGYKFLGWATTSDAKKAEIFSGQAIKVDGEKSDSGTLFAVWELEQTPAPVSDNAISIRTKEMNLDKKEITGGVSTVTIDERYLTSNYKIVVSCSSPDALILDTGETAIEDSFALFIDENGVCGTFKVYVKVYNSTKTTLYYEDYITVTVRDNVYYETIYLNYKDTYQLKENKMEYSFESYNSSIATVDASGKIYASGRGETFVETFDIIDTNIHLYKVVVSYTWWQWIIIILLFGWIWY